MKIKKQAFTLVELIVVMTILTILWTIGFLSFSDYSSDSRDLVRKTDIANSQKVLDLYYLNTNKFPEPHEWIDVVYSWAIVWSQWTFWETTFNMLNKIYWNLKDPLTEDRYTYSVTRNRKEYELWSILENEEEEIIALTSQTHAASKKAYIVWNYNKIFAYAINWDNHYIISTPSIIATDLSDNNIINILWNKKLAYNWYDSLPSSYGYTGSWINIEIQDPIMFKWSKKDLWSYKWIKQINDKLKSVYYGSIMEENNREFLNSSDLTYIKSILLNIVWVNPIEPYYCNEILENSWYENIAASWSVALTASTSKSYSSIEAINNWIKRIDNKFDYEYYSSWKGWFIQFEWDIPKTLWKIKIYNSTKTKSNRLKWSKIKLYSDTWVLLYTKTLWTTANLDEVIVDFKLLWEIHEVKRLIIDAKSNQYLNLREIEIFENEVSIDSWYYTVDSDWVWWSDSYEVYCDMESSWWGWTRIWDNHINRWDFSGWIHTPNYDQVSNRENEVIPMNSPIDSWYALWSHKVSANDFSYALILNDFSVLKKWHEIRLYAWVADVWDQWTHTNWWKWYIFNNVLKYKSNGSSTNWEIETLDTQIIDWKTWKYQRLIIPVNKEPKSFIWYLGKGAETWNGRNFYVSWIKAEIFYK